MPSLMTRLSRFVAFPLALLCLAAADASRAQEPPTTVLEAQVGKLFTGLLGVDFDKEVDGAPPPTPPFTWTLSHGELPPGLQLSKTGKIEGIPTAAATYSFDLLLSDSSYPPRPAILHFSMLVHPTVRPLRVKGVTVTAEPLKIIGVKALDATSNALPSPSTEPALPAPSPSGASRVVQPESVSNVPAQAGGAPAAPQTRAATDDDKQWEARAIVGFHQAGASSAKYTQNFFFDFFIMRALSNQHLWEGRWNVWGDARIASAPQQVSTGVGTFATNFATQVSNLPVNQLAQSADFQTGLEYRLHTWEPDKNYRMAGLIGYFGAMGAFQPPDSQMEIFNVPDKASLQYPAFAAQFPAAADAKYVGFVPPNRERFYRTYGLGLRLTTFDKDQPLAAPATYTVSFGQDEAITGGHFQSIVGKIDVFYPLPLSGTGGSYKFLYLFGNANLRLSRATNIPTFALQNPNANGVTVQPFDPGLAIITVPSTRDTYRIGAGIDLVNLIQSIQTKGKVPATTP